MCGVEVDSDGAEVTRAPRDRSSRSGCACPATSAPRRSSSPWPRRVPGWRVRCPGVGLNPGRTGILAVLEAMGAAVEVDEGEPAGGVEPAGDVEVRGAAPPRDDASPAR